MAAAARLLTSLFQSSRVSFAVASSKSAPTMRPEKTGKECGPQASFVSTLLKVLGSLSV